MKLHNCSSESEQIAWAVTHFKAGGSLSDTALWINGVDQPMRVVGQAKSALRAEGMSVGKQMTRVRDAAGLDHDTLIWRMEPRAPQR